MSTRAIIEIVGNSEAWFDKFAFYKHHDGYPVGIAARIEEIIGQSTLAGGYALLPYPKSYSSSVSLCPEAFIKAESRFEPIRPSQMYNYGQEYQYIIDASEGQIIGYDMGIGGSKDLAELKPIFRMRLESFIEKYLFQNPEYIAEAKARGVEASNQRIIPIGEGYNGVRSYALSDNLLFEAKSILESVDQNMDKKQWGNLSHSVSEAFRKFAQCANAGVRIENAQEISEKFKGYALEFAKSYQWEENRPGGLEDAAKQWGNTFYCRRGFEAFDLSPGPEAPQDAYKSNASQDYEASSPAP